MLRAIEEFYESLEEPLQSCYLAIRTFMLQYDPYITEEWKYKMPFFYYKGKMFCYIWVHKKTGQPYIGIAEGRNIEHPLLIADKRSRMKILYIDPNKDLPVKIMKRIFNMAVKHYK